MNSFINTTRKRLVQNSLLKLAHSFGSYFSATVLCGPNPFEYFNLIQLYITNIGKYIHAYESNIEVFNKVKHSLNNTQIDLICDDIYFSFPTHFIDLDLCGTIITGKYLMYHLFTQQYEHYRNSINPSIFMVSFSRRDSKSGTLRDIFANIEKMIQTTTTNSNFKMFNSDIQKVTTNELDDKGKKIGYMEYSFTNNRDFIIKAMTYNDNGPMINILIKY